MAFLPGTSLPKVGIDLVLDAKGRGNLAAVRKSGDCDSQVLSIMYYSLDPLGGLPTSSRATTLVSRARKRDELIVSMTAHRPRLTRKRASLEFERFMMDERPIYLLLEATGARHWGEVKNVQPATSQYNNNSSRCVHLQIGN